MKIERTALTVGMDVRSSDAQKVGEIKEVRDDAILVDRTLQPDVSVPLRAIASVRAGAVVLAVTAERVDDMYWARAGEDVQVDLSGSYD